MSQALFCLQSTHPQLFFSVAGDSSTMRVFVCHLRQFAAVAVTVVAAFVVSAWAVTQSPSKGLIRKAVELVARNAGGVQVPRKYITELNRFFLEHKHESSHRTIQQHSHL